MSVDLPLDIIKMHVKYLLRRKGLARASVRSKPANTNDRSSSISGSLASALAAITPGKRDESCRKEARKRSKSILTQQPEKKYAANTRSMCRYLAFHFIKCMCMCRDIMLVCICTYYGPRRLFTSDGRRNLHGSRSSIAEK